MANTQLTQKRKRHPLIVAFKAEYNYLEIGQFLKVARSFAYKVHKDFEASDRQGLPVSKCKKPFKMQKNFQNAKSLSDTTRTARFIQQVQLIIDENPRKFMRSNEKNLHVPERTIRNIHEDI